MHPADEDDAAGDPSLAEHIDELLSSVSDAISSPPPARSAAPRTRSVPPPLPRRPSVIDDDSLDDHVDELLAAVSESVGRLEAAPPKPIVVPRGALVVLDHPALGPARSFYEDLLGLVPYDEPDDDSVRYRLGPGSWLLVKRAEPDGARAGAALFVVRDFEDSCRRLEEAGVVFLDPMPDPAAAQRRVRFLDPAGHVVGIATDG
jgi:catechol 2,3-dioxygenase-like lactoylglutathione lyase family enzyme